MLFHGFGFGLGIICMVLFWLVVIGLILAIVRSGRHGHGCCQPTTNDALEIAKIRYAKGEISYEEFERIKKNLS